jgi:glutathione S-transferase
MPLILHQHPLASFCWKVTTALYETGTPFESQMVDLGDEVSRAAFFALWPMGKMPVLEDTERGAVVPETTVIVEYLQTFHPHGAALIPADPDAAWRVRLLDRVFDNYVQAPMQRIVAENFRGPTARDPAGVAEADALLARSYDYLERELGGRAWAAGDAFTLADCAAAPALYYAGKVLPFADSHPALAAYYRRLAARPSFVRVLAEAEPFMPMFPGRPT